jgi:diguanylate cyclase (GGDEF)-like protein
MLEGQVRASSQSFLRQLLPNGLLVVLGAAAFAFFPIAAYQHTARLFLAVILVASLLLSIRLHSLRAFFALSAMGTQFLFLKFAPSPAFVPVVATAFLGMDIALILLVDDAFFDWEAVLWWAGFLAMQWTTLTIASRWAPLWLAQIAAKHVLLPIGAIGVLEITFVVAGLLLFCRFLYSPDAISAGLCWSLVPIFFAARNPAVTSAYLSLSAMALAISLIERSHWIAYHDELTGLPGRRAFKEAMAGLDELYSIAMVDVDFFKKFNDTFGHETGDDVLRKVAGHLAKVEGGRAYRFGGEEFVLVFPDRDLTEAADFAEEVRLRIEQDHFVVRGPDRSTRKREDRRARSKSSGRHSSAVKTGVTVSIGVAESNLRTLAPQEVIEAADKALYQAKQAGRNRVQCFQPRRSRTSADERREETPATIH